MTLEEFEKARQISIVEMLVNQFNNQVGKLDGCDCPKCKNKGVIYVVNYDSITYSKLPCECMTTRKTLSLAQRSGLGALLDDCKFEYYNDYNEQWRKSMYNRAQEFLKDNKSMFFIGGQVGCGKSFLCISMVNEYIKQGLDCKFAVWCDVATTLKQSIMQDSEKYNDLLTELKTATVLYIDDFFKTTPTTADIDKAFQIINYRYNQSRIKNKLCITLISSERTKTDLKDIDEAIATRIMEMATPYYMLTISRDDSKNLRLRK